MQSRPEQSQPRPVEGSIFGQQRLHRTVPDVQNEDRPIDDCEQYPVGSPIAATIEQFANRAVEFPALRRNRATIWKSTQPADGPPDALAPTPRGGCGVA